MAIEDVFIGSLQILQNAAIPEVQRVSSKKV